VHFRNKASVFVRFGGLSRGVPRPAIAPMAIGGALGDMVACGGD